MTELNLIEQYAAAAPIAKWLGFSAQPDGDDIVFTLTFDERHIGNKLIGALHGGAIAAFLEFSAQAALSARLGGGQRIATVNCDVDYLRSARAQDMKARVRFIRIGRRLAFVEALGWQKDEASPVAAARFRFRLDDTEK
ncbi:PaaI family thioesterase [Hyphococcus sp.]|uniref:PaaI family thioesterase n=1 Tax=Hyphococcus sp. TaxID=2038636 RepID=UPI0035C70E1F